MRLRREKVTPLPGKSREADEMSKKKKQNRSTAHSSGDINLTNTEPFSPLKIAELIVCAVATVIGIMYLNGASMSPAAVLPIFTACVLTVAVLRFVSIGRAKEKKISSYILASAIAVLAVAMAALTVAYLVSGDRL